MPRLKEYMGLAMDKLDEQLKPSRADKQTEKRAEQLRADLRQTVLFAGQQNAKLAVAQDRMMGLSTQLYQFYTEISDAENSVSMDPAASETSNEAKAQAGAIMQNLRKIAEEHFEIDAKSQLTPRAKSPTNGGNAEDGNGEESLASSAARIPSLNLSRSIISNRFLKELGTKIGASLNLEEILNESDLRDKLVQGIRITLSQFRFEQFTFDFI